ncbi:MAG: RidA family protein [Dehalococcoidia bacterium]|jgi:enamine deaminase RidA (YjgF/YER057c/UK114 family)|nr:RidA family protein [Dehalococcoidia bacterium]
MAAKQVITPAHYPWADISRYTFSQGVERGGLVFLSGMSAGARDPATGQMVCQGDIVAQARTAYQKMRAVLEAAGLGPENVVKTVDYIPPEGLEGYRGTAAVRQEFFQGQWPAATGIVVERLLRADALIEVEAVAVRGAKRETVNPGWDYYSRYTFAPGVRAGGYLWTSGFAGSQLDDASGQIVYPAGVAAQSRVAYEQIDQVLRAGGASHADAIKTVDYLTTGGLDGYRDTAGVRREFFGTAFPASTGIIMNRLLGPEPVVEIEAMAVLQGERQEVRVPEWEERYSRLTYRPGVRKGKLLFVSGMAEGNPATGETPPDLETQTRTALGKIARVLEVAGGSLRDLVKTVDFITPTALEDYRVTARVRRELLGPDFPAATGVVVNRLLHPQYLIEIDAIAVLD